MSTFSSKVKVECNKQGDLISQSPRVSKWGWIRVTQTRYLIEEDSNILKPIFCSALVQGYIRDLRQLDWHNGMELPGKIVFRDSMTPYRSVKPEKDYKIAGRTGIICTVDGKPIYRKYFYTEDDYLEDVFIPCDETCREKIKSVYLIPEILPQ
jgi:hypothetical protein